LRFRLSRSFNRFGFSRGLRFRLSRSFNGFRYSSFGFAGLGRGRGLNSRFSRFRGSFLYSRWHFYGLGGRCHDNCGRLVLLTERQLRVGSEAENNARKLGDGLHLRNAFGRNRVRLS